MRGAFDEWYRDEHLPDAVKAFGVKKARRFWSFSDPSLHVAMYEFADQAALDRAMGGETLKTLVAEFDALAVARGERWSGRDTWRGPGIHTPDRGYGFRAQPCGLRRNDNCAATPCSLQ